MSTWKDDLIRRTKALIAVADTGELIPAEAVDGCVAVESELKPHRAEASAVEAVDRQLRTLKERLTARLLGGTKVAPGARHLLEVETKEQRRDWNTTAVERVLEHARTELTATIAGMELTTLQRTTLLDALPRILDAGRLAEVAASRGWIGGRRPVLHVVEHPRPAFNI